MIRGSRTLHGAIASLEERVLIEPLVRNEPRQPCRLTADGEAKLAAVVGELEVIAKEGALRLRIP
ncbi:hypothetical protein MLPF_1829 [Mycobacterium lepromatosis]|nr:hypothetical protein MLPF_1829 [Mycobacterium lepromatosis]